MHRVRYQHTMCVVRSREEKNTTQRKQTPIHATYRIRGRYYISNTVICFHVVVVHGCLESDSLLVVVVVVVVGRAIRSALCVCGFCVGSSSMFQPPAFAIATDKVEREAGSICITQHGATLRQTASNERQPKVVGSSSKSKAKP